MFAVELDMGHVHHRTLVKKSGRKSWRTFQNTFEAVKGVEEEHKGRRASSGNRRVSTEGMPSPEHRAFPASAAAGLQSHGSGWQLRMLAAPGGIPGAADSGGDSEATLSELSNALRSAVAQNLSDPDWMPKLHAFR